MPTLYNLSDEIQLNNSLITLNFLISFGLFYLCLCFYCVIHNNKNSSKKFIFYIFQQKKQLLKKTFFRFIQNPDKKK